MKIISGQFCPIAKAAEVLGERWTILILRELLLGKTRFTELQRALPLLSPALLSKRLLQLQGYGLLIRKETPPLRRAEYFLTTAGKELQMVVQGLSEWGTRWASIQMEDNARKLVEQQLTASQVSELVPLERQSAADPLPGLLVEPAPLYRLPPVEGLNTELTP